jgi:hypothetical protein
MTWQMAMHGRGNEEATEWSGHPACLEDHGAQHPQHSTNPVDPHTLAASSQLNSHPAESHGLVCFAERRTLVSARVLSNLNCTLPRE